MGGEVFGPEGIGSQSQVLVQYELTKFTISLNPMGHSVLNYLALILRFYIDDKADLSNMDEKY